MFDEISFSILFAAVGIILMVLGWIRPVGMTLYCRRCAYNLTANSSGICPECGSEVGPETAHFGLRKTNRIIFGCGFIICVLGLPWTADGLRFVSDQDWYEYYPTFVILGDLDEDESRKRAMAEIRRRISNDQLNVRQTIAAAKQLVSICDPLKASEIEEGIVLDAHFACEQLAQEDKLPAENLRTWLRQREEIRIHWWPGESKWAFDSVLIGHVPRWTSSLLRHYSVEIVEFDGELVRETIYEALTSNAARLLTEPLPLTDRLSGASTVTMRIMVTTRQRVAQSENFLLWAAPRGSVCHTIDPRDAVFQDRSQYLLRGSSELDRYTVQFELSLNDIDGRQEINPLSEAARWVTGPAPDIPWAKAWPLVTDPAREQPPTNPGLPPLLPLSSSWGTIPSSN